MAESLTWPSRHRVAAVSGRSPDWMAVFLKVKTAHDRCANASKQANQKQAGHKARLQEIRKEAHDQLQAAEAQLGLAPKPAAAGKRSRSEVEPDGGGAEALQNLDRMSLVLSDDDAPCCLDVDTMGLHGAHDPKLAMPIADLSRHGFVVVKQKQHRLESDRTVVTSVTGLWDGRPAVGRAFVQDWVFLPNIHYAGMLSHANIVTMDPVQEHRFVVYLDVQQDLARAIETNQAFGHADSIRLLRGCLRGAEYMHQQDLLHGSINPSSVMLTSGKHVKLAGFEHVADCSHLLTGNRNSGVYSAPEMRAGDYYGPAVDLWAIGCCVVEAIKGQKLLSLYPSANECDCSPALACALQTLLRTTPTERLAASCLFECDQDRAEEHIAAVARLVGDPKAFINEYVAFKSQALVRESPRLRA